MECVPFVLRLIGKGGAETDIHVKEPAEAGFIGDDLTITYNNFEPNNSGVLTRGVDRLFGEVTKGIHTKEKMLLTNTVLLGIGEIALVDDKLQLRPPKSGSKYILTTLSKEEVIKRLDSRSFWVKLFMVITGTVSAAVLLYLLRKYFKKWREEQDRLEFLSQMRAMRERTSTEDENCCVVCLSNPREIVLLNCGHLCLCGECLACLPDPQKCPVCRQDVQRFVTIYTP